METQQETQEHGSITAFFEDLAKTRDRVDWQADRLCKANDGNGPIRAVQKGARLGDAKLAVCDCPIVAVAKMRATKIMRADWPTAFHLTNGSKAVEMARAVNVSTAFVQDVINAADGHTLTDEYGDEVPIYSQELRNRLLKATGIIEA